MEKLPLILASISTGAELLGRLNELASRGTVSDEELAAFAERMEAALAESQTLLRGGGDA